MEGNNNSLNGREIAVIGMAGRFPGAGTLDEFWRNLRNGSEAVTFLKDEELLASGVEPEHLTNPNYVRAASLLDGVELFDAPFFGYNAREAELLDPQQRLFLEDAWHALENAGYSPRDYEGSIGVYAGAAWNTYLLSNLTTHPELFDAGGGFQVFIASDKDFMPTRAAYKFNLKGPSVIIQTSCSTSLVAVHLACLSLLNYECDIALAGGVTIKVPQRAGYFYQEGGLASPDGHCRAFDAGAAGTIFGSGSGVVVLKRFAEARDEGDNIRAVIKGSAINNDGSAKISYTAPSVEGQAEVIAAAHAMAGLDAETIGYVETHGTGTSLGDPVEITALTRVFRRHTGKKSFCAIGSVKSNIGHLDAAAGIAGFIKTVLALEQRELPPSINFESPNPSVNFPETPFYVNAKLQPWTNDDGPRRAAVSSFGVGGTNAHLILEEAPAADLRGRSRRWQLIPLSARTSEALETATAGFLSWLRGNERFELPDIAYTLKVGRAVFRHRRVLVCREREDAIAALESANSSRLLTAADTDEPRDRPVVFMFPGQGSQYIRMVEGLYQEERLFRERFDECSRLLEQHLGFRLAALLYSENDPDDESISRITRTSVAQPALFTVEYALARMWMAWGVKPAAMIGHSIGEYVAACVAGVMSLEDALALVAVRGQLMQQQPAGTMLAVPLPEQEVTPLLPEGVSVAAVNEPSSCVVSGPADAVAGLERELEKREIDFRPLHTSHAFHSSMMEPVLEPFGNRVSRIRLNAPRIPFVSNVSGAWITPEQATNPIYWTRQLRETVRFSRGISELLIDSDRIFLEVGPGRTLSTLVTRQGEGRGRTVISSIRHPKEEVPDSALMLESLGRLWLSGVKVDWRSFYEGERRLRAPLPTYPFERQRYWIEPRPRQHGAAVDSSGRTVIKNPNLSEWFYLPAWKPSPLNDDLRRQVAEPVLILSDRGGFGHALAARLVERGRDVISIEAGDGFERNAEAAYTIRPVEGADYASLFEELQRRQLMPRSIVHALSLSRPASGTADALDLDGCLGNCFYSLLTLLQTLERFSEKKIEVTVLADESVSITAQEPVAPAKTSMIGLCRVAGQELANVEMRFIDLSIPVLDGSSNAPEMLSAAVDSLIDELDSDQRDPVVAYRGRQRLVQAFEPIKPAADNAGRLKERGVYLITGGLQGNGFAVARYLARRFNARLLLVEDAVPGAVEREGANDGSVQVEVLRNLGGEVHVVNADITLPDDLRRALSEGEQRFGLIDGVIHAAEQSGELAFQALAEVTRDECERHFRPKARALWALEAALENRKLDFCVLLSSLAAVMGGVGYGSYAAANLFLDSFVKRHNRLGSSPWLCLNLDLWSDEGGGDRIVEVRGELSELAMSAGEGEEAFRRALSTRGVDQLLISAANLPARLASIKQRFSDLRSRRDDRKAAGAGSSLHPRPPLPTSYVAPGSDLEHRIAAVWQQVLGFEQIGLDDNFFDLGGDSLIAIRVVSRMKEELRVDFPVAKLYQGVTLRTLAQLLARDESEDQRRRAEQLAGHKEAAGRRRDYIERRRARR